MLLQERRAFPPKALQQMHDYDVSRLAILFAELPTSPSPSESLLLTRCIRDLLNLRLLESTRYKVAFINLITIQDLL